MLLFKQVRLLSFFWQSDTGLLEEEFRFDGQHKFHRHESTDVLFEPFVVRDDFGFAIKELEELDRGLNLGDTHRGGEHHDERRNADNRVVAYNPGANGIPESMQQRQ